MLDRKQWQNCLRVAGFCREKRPGSVMKNGRRIDICRVGHRIHCMTKRFMHRELCSSNTSHVLDYLDFLCDFPSSGLRLSHVAWFCLAMVEEIVVCDLGNTIISELSWRIFVIQHLTCL